MRLLIYEWEAYLQYDLISVCRERQIDTDSFRWKFRSKNEDEEFETWFEQNVTCSLYAAVVSINYWPMISKVAQKHGIPYIAWCYDNPLNVIEPEKTLGNSVNTVVFFDKIQAQKYRDKGFETVHHMPLCVNKTRMQELHLSKQDKERFAAEVSFVGSLYESRIADIRVVLDEYDRGFVDAAMAAQQTMYGYYMFDDLISDEWIAAVNNKIHVEHPETNFKLRKEALTFAMASEVTRKERLMLLTLLGRRYDTKLYSFHESALLQQVKCLPPVDYVIEMPKVFKATKINLNPVLRCIQSGIPLRALDIMAAGGFLLSSFQPELYEQFAQEEEMVCYESIEDAIEKADFYIKHDSIREQIAANGQKKVLEEYTMQQRLGQILLLAGLSI